VNVRVDHPGHQELAGAVDDARTGGRQHRRADRGDAIAFDHHRSATQGRAAGTINDCYASDRNRAATLGEGDDRHGDDEGG
jgi:hypothetical protein